MRVRIFGQYMHPYRTWVFASCGLGVVALVLCICMLSWGRGSHAWMGTNIVSDPPGGYMIHYPGMDVHASSITPDQDGIHLQGWTLSDASVSIHGVQGAWHRRLTFDGASNIDVSMVDIYAYGVHWRSGKGSLMFIPHMGIQSMALYDVSMTDVPGWPIHMDQMIVHWDPGLIAARGWGNALVGIDASGVSLRGTPISSVSVGVDLIDKAGVSLIRATALGVHLPALPSWGWPEMTVPITCTVDVPHKTITWSIEGVLGRGWIGMSVPTMPVNWVALLEGGLRPDSIVGRWDDTGASDHWNDAHRPLDADPQAWRTAVESALLDHSWVSRAMLSRSVVHQVVMGHTTMVWGLVPSAGEDLSTLWTHFWNPVAPAAGQFWAGSKENAPDPWRLPPRSL